MSTFLYFFLFTFWAIFWSFASVIIYRIKSWEWWIMWWRSHCTSCSKILQTLDLIPILSQIINKWVCRHCKKVVSKVYTILEITSWLLFALIWYFLIDLSLLAEWDTVEIIKLGFFLIIWFFTIIYTFYDILFLEIPESILALWIVLTLIILSIQTVVMWINIIDLPTNYSYGLEVWIAAIVLSLFIIWWLYVIMLKWLKEIWDILILVVIIFSLFLFKHFTEINLTDINILNWVIWALGIFIFFFIQIVISRWVWMWWWDLRIAIFIWLILWSSLSFSWVMITYIIWSIIWLWLIAYSRIKHLWKKKATGLNTQIPFWPFLAVWFFITLFYQNQILELIKMYI